MRRLCCPLIFDDIQSLALGLVREGPAPRSYAGVWCAVSVFGSSHRPVMQEEQPLVCHFG